MDGMEIVYCIRGHSRMIGIGEPSLTCPTCKAADGLLEIEEQPMNTDTDTDTDTEELAMYNVWDQDGIWVGIQRGIVNHVRSYTYELIPKSDYPKIPIADGVYRVEVDGEGPSFGHFLERKNKEWLFGDGTIFAHEPYRLKILEKYTKETK